MYHYQWLIREEEEEEEVASTSFFTFLGLVDDDVLGLAAQR